MVLFCQKKICNSVGYMKTNAILLVTKASTKDEKKHHHVPFSHLLPFPFLNQKQNLSYVIFFLILKKAMYGMTSTGGYTTQYSRQLERDVTRNKTSVGDYYARKAEMLKILMTDNDSGESCTRGKIS